MTAVECLEELRAMRIRLRRLERDIKALRMKLCSLRAIDYSKDRVCGGLTGDLADQVAFYTDKLNEARRQWDEFIEMCDKIDALIDKIPNERLRNILHERYINNGSWNDVADIIGVSREWVRKELYPEAIKEFDRVLKEEGTLE